jgi:hypothetical protein
MGYIRNHAIIVTATYGNYIELAHAKATKIFPWVSPISVPELNESRSFFIPPDGSKEGWVESDIGNKERAEFKSWLRKQAYEDESTPLDWCEVRYGGNDLDAAVEAHCHEKILICPKR